MGIGTKIKEALTGDHHDSSKASYNAPGAYPSDDSTGTARKDKVTHGTTHGSHATATHTPGHSSTSAYDSGHTSTTKHDNLTHGSSSHATGGTSTYDRTHEGTTGHRHTSSDSPARTSPGRISPGRTDNNPLSTAGIAGDTIGGHTGSSRNKLQKSNDARDLEDPSFGRAHEGGLGSHGTHGDTTHHGIGQKYDDQRYDVGVPGATGTTGTHHSTGYGTGSGLNDPSSTTRTPQVPEKDIGSHGHHSGLAGGAAAAGAGGLAAHEFSDRHNRGHATDSTYGHHEGSGGGVYNTVTGTGSSEAAHTGHGYGHSGTGNTVGSGIGATSGSGLGGNHHDTTGTHGAGAPQIGALGHERTNPGLLDPDGLSSGGSRTTGTHYGQGLHDTTSGTRDYGHQGQHSNVTSGLVGAGAGVGAGAAASHLAHRPRHSQEQVGGRSDPYQSTAVSGGSGGFNEPSSATSRDVHSSRLSSGGNSHTSGFGNTGTGHVGSSGVPSVASGTGPDHYGPGHSGAKVFHRCQHCGQDNDISKYFSKEATYRLG